METHSEHRAIFVIDDDPDVGFLMKHILKKSGVPNPLRIWTDSMQALADLRELASVVPDPADLPLFLLIDLKMPNLSGFELLAWLREQHALARVPRIVMTSSMDRRDAERAYALGANGFLTKYPSAFILAAITRFANDPETSREGAAAHFSVGAFG